MWQSEAPLSPGRQPAPNKPPPTVNEAMCSNKSELQFAQRPVVHVKYITYFG